MRIPPLRRQRLNLLPLPSFLPSPTPNRLKKKKNLGDVIGSIITNTGYGLTSGLIPTLLRCILYNPAHVHLLTFLRSPRAQGTDISRTHPVPSSLMHFSKGTYIQHSRIYMTYVALFFLRHCGTLSQLLTQLGIKLMALEAIASSSHYYAPHSYESTVEAFIWC